jgi:hypothetical protein
MSRIKWPHQKIKRRDCEENGGLYFKKHALHMVEPQLWNNVSAEFINQEERWRNLHGWTVEK